MSWSPDGTVLVSCSLYGQCHIWQPATDVLIKEHRFSLPPHFFLYLRDGRLATNPLASDVPTCPDSSHWQVQLWNKEQTQVDVVLDDGARLCDDYICAAVSSSAPLFALGTEGGQVQLWKYRFGEVPTLRNHLPFHQDTVQGLAWSPDGFYLASGAADGHVAVWAMGGNLCFHAGRSGGVQDVSWWRDVLAVADGAGKVALYRIPLLSSRRPA